MMTATEFRTMALSFPGVVESSHLSHPDFRVGGSEGKIFATLGPDETWAMVKLTPAQQSVLLRAKPGAYSPASGAWGKRGATIIQLRVATKSSVRKALIEAFNNVAAASVKRRNR